MQCRKQREVAVPKGGVAMSSSGLQPYLICAGVHGTVTFDNFAVYRKFWLVTSSGLTKHPDV